MTTPERFIARHRPPWLSRLATTAARPGTRIAALVLLALVVAANLRGLDQREGEQAASTSMAEELPANAAELVNWCGVWGSDSIVVVVGFELINRSTDSGRTWRTVASGTKGHLCGVGGYASTVLAAGQWGALLRSTDGGATWSNIGTGSDQDWMHGAWALGSTAIVVGGDVLLRSTDGGATWSRARLPRGLRGYALTHVRGDDASIVVASNNGIYRSTDAGQSWSRVWPPDGYVIKKVWGSGRTVIGVGTWGTIVRSTDGGATWTKILGEQPRPAREVDGMLMSEGPTVNLGGVAGSGATVVAVGTGGAMLRSTDGGATWIAIAAGTMHHLSAVWGSDSLFVAVGDAGTILVSRDGGTRWAPPDSSLAGRPLVAVAGSSRLFLAIGPSGTVGRSTDGGLTWTGVTGAWTSEHLRGAWAGGGIALAVGDGGVILRSLDDGETWTNASMEIATGPLPAKPGDPAPPAGGVLATILSTISRAPRNFLAVAATDTLALIVGDGGTVLRSTDRGVTWSLLDSPTHSRLAAVWMSETAATTVGSDGSIAVSNDGGATWTAAHSGTDAHLTGVWGSYAAVVAVGYGGTILRSTDAGGTWSQVAGGTNADLAAIWGVGDVLVVVGWGGTILRSSDGGASWTRVMGETWPESVTWNQRHRLRQASTGWWSVSGSGSTVIAIGRYGTILRSTDQGATWSEPGGVIHPRQP
jgi:photosystem II stability/assembly factor-like uncharacterized protein